jgi:hypothetical protein
MAESKEAQQLKLLVLWILNSINIGRALEESSWILLMEAFFPTMVSYLVKMLIDYQYWIHSSNSFPNEE